MNDTARTAPAGRMTTSRVKVADRNVAGLRPTLTLMMLVQLVQKLAPVVKVAISVCQSKKVSL